MRHFCTIVKRMRDFAIYMHFFIDKKLFFSLGHMVPHDQPKRAFDLINRFTSGKSFQPEKKKRWIMPYLMKLYTPTASKYSLYLCRVLFKYCVFSKILKHIQDSGLSRFPLGVSVCTQWQVKHSATAELAEFRKITTF